MINKAHAIVIGAGTIGAATAWQLSQQGLDNVLLIDRNTIGSGNTSKAASLMTLVRTKEAMIPLIQETYRNIDVIEAFTGMSTGKMKVGTIHVAASDESIANLKKITDIANRHSIKNRALNISELEEKLPWIDSSKVLKSVFMEEDSFVDAYSLATVYATAAKKNGVHILQNTEVLEILSENNKIKGIKTDKGVIESPIVVDAAGAWANQLSLQVNVPIPMAPVRSIYWILEKNEKLFTPNQPMVVMPDAMAYTRPDGDSLLFGLREENSPHFHPNDLNPKPNLDFLGDAEDEWEIILDYGIKFSSMFPEFKNIGIKNCITGISTYTPDGYYTFGKSEEIEGFFIAAGCAGAGVAGSGGIGRMIAEMVLDKELFANKEPFRIDRFVDFDPMSTTFRQSCADARSRKKDGG